MNTIYDEITNLKIPLKERILKYINRNDNVTFAELTRLIPDFKGDRAMFSKENESLLIWNGVADESIDAISSLIDSGDILMKTTTPFIYFIDGRVPRLKVAKSLKRKYKEKRWIPTILTIRKKGE